MTIDNEGTISDVGQESIQWILRGTFKQAGRSVIISRGPGTSPTVQSRSVIPQPGRYRAACCGT